MKMGLYGMNIKGPFTRINYDVINLNSDKQVKDYLLSQGWQPTQWNYKKDGKRVLYDENGEKIKTSPKLTEDSFDSVEGDIPKLVARRSVLLHRRGTISNIKDPENKGWLSNIRADGRIEACAVPQACNTGRFRHSVVVNVPKASPKVPYGTEMRSLFKASPGYVMVGVDAKALEARTEAHNCYPFTGGEAYAHTLIDGDIHAANAAIFGTDRDGAKAPKYALKLAHVKSCELRGSL